jgi:hemin uptake protein HemP
MNFEQSLTNSEDTSSSDTAHLAKCDRRDKGLLQWDSGTLLGGRGEAIILNGDEEYRIRCTKNNKLILHK